MKRYFLTLLALMFLQVTAAFASDSKPEWVSGAPYNSLNYIGIGSATTSEANFQELATQRALRSMAGQIKVEISSQSILKTIDDNGQISQTFQEDIVTKVSDNLEGYHLIDTWQGDSQYWVYYELNRFDYEDMIKARREKAISTALDYWIKGNQSLSRGAVEGAADLYIKGLEALEDVMHEDLICDYQGNRINIANELYNSITNVWSGVAVVANPEAVAVEHLKGIATPIAIGCYKNGVPMAQVNLKAQFVNGAGILSELAPTSAQGVSALYIKNVTGKDSFQQIKVSVNATCSQPGSKWASLVLSKVKLPTALISLNMGNQRTTAYLFYPVEMVLYPLNNSLNSIISNNYFDVVSNPDQADVIIKLTSSFARGREVVGDLYNTQEYMGDLNAEIIDNRTFRTISNYSTNQVKALVRKGSSEVQGKQSVCREILKRLNREFPMVLKNISIDRSLPIPHRDLVPQAAPIPTPAPVPTPIPDAVPVPTPVPSLPTTTPAPANVIKGYMDSDILVTVNKLTKLNDKSYIHLTILNESSKEYSIYESINSMFKVYNQRGGLTRINYLTLAGQRVQGILRCQLIAGIPTELVVVVDELESVALLQINSLKLRGIK